MSRRFFICPLALVVVVLAGLPSWSASAESYGEAVLQGLDKVTGRISTFSASLDEPVRFGNLEITVRACDKRPPEEPPEKTAFFEIVELREGEPMKDLFSGWMFASSPAISALEHGVYDVWLLDCQNKLASPPEEGTTATPSTDKAN